jgi:hypothetical protein
MRYLNIDTGPWPDRSELPWWIRLLSKALPAANPDIEHHHTHTHSWWLEVSEDGEPKREIGFDESGKPIVLAPVGDNCGVLVDATDHWLDITRECPLAAAKFDTVWQSLWPQFKHLDQGEKDER